MSRSAGREVRGQTGPFQGLRSHADEVLLMGAPGSHAVGWEEVGASLTLASEHLDFTDWQAANSLANVDEEVAFTCDVEHTRHEVNGETHERALRQPGLPVRRPAVTHQVPFAWTPWQ